MHIIQFRNSPKTILLSLLFMLTSFANVVAFAPKPGGILMKADTLQKISMMFMISHGDQNLIDIKSHPAFRSDNNFAFSSNDDFPEGLVLSDNGLVTWSPTAQQFTSLKQSPMMLSFYARSIDNDYILGEIRIVAHGELKESVQAPVVAPAETTAAEVVSVTTTSPEEPDTEPLTIVLPEQKNYNSRDEGEEFSFDLKHAGGQGDIKFELLEPAFLMENLDQYGSFDWTPDFDFTNSSEYIKSVNIKIKAFDNDGEVAYQTIQLFVKHINRPPVVHELPTFYIQFNSKNTYQLGKQGFVFDPDGDSIIFNPVLRELPQGVSLNKNGFISWSPSRGQFNALAAKAISLSFTVEDYPYGLKTIGQVRLEVSQADLPPEITMMPSKTNFDIKENEELQLTFFIADPNGENDILSFGFVTENSSIQDNALQRKENWQYEFTWTPGFDFIKEVGQKQEFDISFFAIDKESNRSEKNILVMVEDTENLVEKDKLYYDQYRTVLDRAYDMISQLTEKEKELEKKYKHSKKGKKNRAITTASLGALTGLSPVFFIENPQGQKVAAGLGGTATATIGTLEASNVIGEPPTDIMRDLNYVSQKKNDLMIYGNVFASKYALPISKRDKSFESDLRSLSLNLSLSDAAKLNLDAAWENSKPGNTKNLKRVFKDFNPDPRFEDQFNE